MGGTKERPRVLVGKGRGCTHGEADLSGRIPFPHCDSGGL